jgi:hypothetical protein
MNVSHEDAIFLTSSNAIMCSRLGRMGCAMHVVVRAEKIRSRDKEKMVELCDLNFDIRQITCAFLAWCRWLPTFWLVRQLMRMVV